MLPSKERNPHFLPQSVAIDPQSVALITLNLLLQVEVWPKRTPDLLPTPKVLL